MGSLWQEGMGWIPQPGPGPDMQAMELAAQSNHYCHAQRGAHSQHDLKREQARRQLYVASAICLVFMVGEIIGKDFVPGRGSWCLHRLGVPVKAALTAPFTEHVLCSLQTHELASSLTSFVLSFSLVSDEIEACPG